MGTERVLAKARKLAKRLAGKIDELTTVAIKSARSIPDSTVMLRLASS